MRIDIDTCEEILITITRNKTRSLLTAFGVFWGIFMLVALIGGGQGLQDMMQKNFEGFATNSGFLAAQKTGEAYKGFRKGRWWDLEAIDIERLRSQVKDVEVITPFRCPLGIQRYLWRQEIRLQCERIISRLSPYRITGNGIRAFYQRRRYP